MLEDDQGGIYDINRRQYRESIGSFKDIDNKRQSMKKSQTQLI